MKLGRQIYLIGSLRNPKVPIVANILTDAGYKVFDDWFAAGELADDEWRKYEILRGRDYLTAIKGPAAEHVFQFDLTNMEKSDFAVLMLPAGKSGHLELGWMLGQGKKGYILLDDAPPRWDVMYRFATGVFGDVLDLLAALGED